MADEPSPPVETLPAVLPPEEESAATADAPGNDLADLEAEWLNSTLSAHALEAAALKNELARAHIKNIDADRGMRTKYAGRILLYLELYSIGVLALLLLAGFKAKGFSLEKDVIVALVGSTAIAAIGLVGFIARGLFQSPPPPPSV